MELKNLLLTLNPRIQAINLQEILDNGASLGWKCFIQNSSNNAFAGGTSQSKETALRIAVAEAFERSYLEHIHADKNLKDSFLIQEYPSSSGFAAGFENKKTKFRAICEGLERWAWSKWIDEGFKMNSLSPSKPLSSLANYLSKPFNETYWFEKNFKIQTNDFKELKLKFVVFLGCTNTGIFPGSRVSTEEDDLFEHPIIEAHRNYLNYQLHLNSPINLTDIIQKRTVFYGSNKDLALRQVINATNDNWPLPKIKLLKEFKTDHPNLFLYRCLFEDFIGWHEGDVTRFVY